MDSEGSSKTRSTASLNCSDEDTPLLARSNSGSSSATSGTAEPGKKRQCLSLEPVAVALCFGWSMSGIVLSNQIIHQTCLYMGYNASLCATLGANTNSSHARELEALVQPTVAKITMASSIITSVIPALCGLFLGPWSDKFGRKPVMIMPCVGYVVSFITKAIICQVSTRTPLNPWLYVFADIPAALSGGTTVFCAGMFSYLADVSNEENRAVRMGMLQGSSLGGAFMGMLSSSFILQWTSTSTVFVISASMMLFGMAYVLILIEDSVDRSPANVSMGRCRKLREIFRLDLVMDIFNTFFKARSGNDRGIIWLTVVIGAFSVLGSGGSNIFYLFTRNKFNWSLEQYTIWQSADLFSIIVGNFLGILILKKVFKLPDIAIAFVSVLCFSGDSFIKGLASHGWQLYLATGLTPLKGTEGAALMALSSKILPSQDIAKVYSMAMSLTATVPLAAAPLFTYIYSQTLTTAPEAFNFVASGIFAVNILFVGIIHVLLKNRQNHQRLYAAEDGENEVLA
ncbi:probable peptidoglycan muropeptide transporter SLC46 [Aedes albopictus]|uniref:Major facilitator superfamily (MFS) profile domain-containing protein n=1 Tax=Aedes albopictus TaxID=7160 RepID=A0ABM1YDT3_AEDAL|nr:proton-coupled folate transporter-like [Aedes albopictus]